MKKFTIYFAFYIFVFSFSCLAVMPRTFNYQGKLLNVTTKTPVTSSMLATFLIYDNATSGSPLWQEEQLVSPDANGIISVVLGNTIPIIADFSQQLWLAVEAPTGVSNALWPRRQLTAAPYAMFAVSVEGGAPAGGWVDTGSVVKLVSPTDTVSVEGKAIFTNKVGIGTAEPSATLDVKGTVKMFGTYEVIQDTSTAADVGPFQAATDGFVVVSMAYVEPAGASCWGTYYGYTDASSTPTTRVCGGGFDYTHTGILSGGFTMPVKKGYYWKIKQEPAHPFAGNYNVKIFWVPLGQ